MLGNLSIHRGFSGCSGFASCLAPSWRAFWCKWNQHYDLFVDEDSVVECPSNFPRAAAQHLAYGRVLTRIQVSTANLVIFVLSPLVCSLPGPDAPEQLLSVLSVGSRGAGRSSPNGKEPVHHRAHAQPEHRQDPGGRDRRFRGVRLWRARLKTSLAKLTAGRQWRPRTRSPHCSSASWLRKEEQGPWSPWALESSWLGALG